MPLQDFLLAKPIVAPSASRRRNNLDDGSDIDRFAILFSPPTPPASPAPVPVSEQRPSAGPSRPPPITPSRVAPRHVSARSTSAESDEFGSFVSVSRAEDPLSPAACVDSPIDAFASPNYSLHFFENFAQEARVSLERTRRGILDELLTHEDDPLYFVQASEKPSEPNQAIDISADIGLTQNAEHVGTQLVDLSMDPFSLDGTSHSQALDEDYFRQPPPDSAPSQTPELSKPAETVPPPSTLPSSSSETSLPPFGTLSARWMANLLSASRPSPPSMSETKSDPLDAHFAAEPKPILETRNSSPASSLDAKSFLIPFATSSHSVPPLKPRHTLSLSHGSPFSSHPFIPPSGAPGFGGDRLWDKGFSDDPEIMEVAESKLVLEGRKEGTTEVLSGLLANSLRSYLPALARLPQTWTLLYSMDQHGISLNTLYTQCQPAEAPNTATSGALLVIKDECGAVFGAWVADGIRKGQGGYYGGGDSFLWTCENGGDSGPNQPRVFKWTGRNDYVALCETDFISFGGGDGHYGLYVDDTLLRGTTSWCPTFENDALCIFGATGRSAIDVDFECVDLEVWAIGP